MSVKIIPLSEGVFTIGKDKIFKPFDLDKDNLLDRKTGSLLVEIQPFLIINNEDIILLDTGLGFTNPESSNLQLIQNLYDNQVHPNDVTKVLISHLHKDHAGGLRVDLFPEAKFYIYKKEYEYAIATGLPSYTSQDFEKLTEADNVVWLEDTSGTIDHYIQYIHTGGHSKEHIVFKIFHEDGSIIFYGGDEAPQYKQIKTRYIAKYDFDGKHAMSLRKQWAEEASENNWTMLFYHDVKYPLHHF